MQQRLTARAAMICALALAACQGGEKKSDGGDFKGSDKGSSDRPSKAEGSAQASSSRVTVTNSLSNNPLTSQTITDGKAEAELNKFKGAKTILELEGVISSERLARKSLSEVLASARRLAHAEMEKGAGRSIPSDVKLEIALAAIYSRNFALAAYYLEDLTDSKNNHLRAGSFNALGVIALHDDRVPEAVLYFREALKAVSNYKPALLNLGFAALKGGDIQAAKATLSKVEGDWFVQYGLISVARMEGDSGQGLEHCERVLKKAPDHVAALFNCALLEYQNKNNVAKAKEYLAKAIKAKGGEADWGEKAYLLSSKIETEQAQQKHDEARHKAEKAAAEKAKAKPKAAAPAPAAAAAPTSGAAPAAPQKEAPAGN